MVNNVESNGTIATSQSINPGPDAGGSSFLTINGNPAGFGAAEENIFDRYGYGLRAG